MLVTKRRKFVETYRQHVSNLVTLYPGRRFWGPWYCQGLFAEPKGVSKLPDVTEPLERFAVENPQGFGIDPDVVPERIADYLEIGWHDE